MAQLEMPDAGYLSQTADVDLSGIRDQASVIHFQPPNHQITKSPNILIVEDNPDMRGYIGNSLYHFYQIAEAEDGAEGFKTALKIAPDLIISDVMMPKMDGYQFCEKIKTDPRTSHI
ncbi:MAG: response regulator, partial [Planctomycetota bacterium]